MRIAQKRYHNTQINRVKIFRKRFIHSVQRYGLKDLVFKAEGLDGSRSSEIRIMEVSPEVEFRIFKAQESQMLVTFYIYVVDAKYAGEWVGKWVEYRDVKTSQIYN